MSHGATDAFPLFAVQQSLVFKCHGSLVDSWVVSGIGVSIALPPAVCKHSF